MKYNNKATKTRLPGLRKTAIAAVHMYLAHISCESNHASRCEAYMTTSPSSSSTMSSNKALHYRLTMEEHEAVSSQNIFFQEQERQSPAMHDSLDSHKVWLDKYQTSYLAAQYHAEEAMRAVQSTLSSSSLYLSAAEREDIVQALHIASAAAAKRLSKYQDMHEEEAKYMYLTGAAEFVGDMLLNLEYLGRDAFIAAAFHYCANADVYYNRHYDDVSSEEDVNIYLNKLKSYDEEISQFGPSVSKIAYSAARMKGVEMLASNSYNTENKEHENLAGLLVSVCEDWQALAIRSYACLFRLKGIEAEKDDPTSISTAPNVRVAVAKEALKVHAVLSQRLGFYVLKSALEDSAFHILYPRQYDRVQSILDVQREGLEAVFDSVNRKIKDVLLEDSTLISHVDSIQITGRIKEPYSMWRKILRKRCEKVADTVALRVVLSAKKKTPNEDEEVTSARNRALCYYVQEMCMRTYAPMSENEHRIKDYIAYPKKNGYQSLHYTANMRWHGENWPFEVQVRSAQMHRVAEHGVAAHWGYKYNPSDSNDDEQQGPVNSVFAESLTSQSRSRKGSSDGKFSNPFNFEADGCLNDEVEEHLAPYLEAMSEAHSDQKRDHVYIFLMENNSSVQREHSKGRIVSLPAGACVRDALGANNQINNSKFIMCNGEFCPSMFQPLSNGDVLSIQIPKTSPPVYV